MSTLRKPRSTIRLLYEALAIYFLCIVAGALFFMMLYWIPYLVILLVIEILPKAAHADPANQTTDPSRQSGGINPVFSNPRSRLSPGMLQYLLTSQTLTNASRSPATTREGMQHNSPDHIVRPWPDVLGRTGFSSRYAQARGTAVDSLVDPQSFIGRNGETGGLYASSAIGGYVGYIGEERAKQLWREYAGRVGTIFGGEGCQPPLIKMGGNVNLYPPASGGLRGAFIGASSAGMLWKWWGVELIRPVISGPRQ